MGLNSLKNLYTTHLEGKIGIIIDESIMIGNSKMLLILFTSAFREKVDGALDFSAVRVAYLGYSTSWTAEKIKKILVDLVAESKLQISYVVSDEVSTLKCATRLFGGIHLPDVSHFLGTCLRKTYKENMLYKQFISLLSAYKSKGINQALTHLLPPKQRAKARFMNQKPLIDWANCVLSKYASLNEKEKLFFKDLHKHTKILKSLTACLEVAEFVGLYYKKQGLSVETCQKISDYITDYKIVDEQHQLFMKHLLAYTKEYKCKLALIYENRGIVAEKQATNILNISSDVIESVFGKYKHTASTNQLIGVPTTSLEVPLYPMDITQLTEMIIPSIEEILGKEIDAWKQEQNVENQAIKRREFFTK